MTRLWHGHQCEGAVPSAIVDPVATDLLLAVSGVVVNLPILLPKASVDVEQFLHPDVLAHGAVASIELARHDDVSVVLLKQIVVDRAVVDYIVVQVSFADTFTRRFPDRLFRAVCDMQSLVHLLDLWIGGQVIHVGLLDDVPVLGKDASIIAKNVSRDCPDITHDPAASVRILRCIDCLHITAPLLESVDLKQVVIIDDVEGVRNVVPVCQLRDRIEWVDDQGSFQWNCSTWRRFVVLEDLLRKEREVFAAVGFTGQVKVIPAQIGVQIEETCNELYKFIRTVVHVSQGGVRIAESSIDWLVDVDHVVVLGPCLVRVRNAKVVSVLSDSQGAVFEK